MTLADMRTAVLNQLAEVTSAPSAYTAAQVTRGINEGLNMFALATGRPQASDTLTLTPGVTLNLVPSSLLQLLELRIAGRLLTKADVHALETKRPGWLGDLPGTPREWFPVGRYRFGLYPRPDSAYTVAFRGVKQPADLSADADVPPLPVEDHEALVRYAMYYGLLSGNDQDLDRALLLYGVPDQQGVIPSGSFMAYVAKASGDQGRVQRVLAAEVAA